MERSSFHHLHLNIHDNCSTFVCRSLAVLETFRKLCINRNNQHFLVCFECQAEGELSVMPVHVALQISISSLGSANVTLKIKTKKFCSFILENFIYIYIFPFPSFNSSIYFHVPLPTSFPPKKNGFPFPNSHHLLARREAQGTLLAGLLVYRSCAGNCSCSEFINVRPCDVQKTAHHSTPLCPPALSKPL